MTSRESFTFTPDQGVPPGVAPFSHVTKFGELLFVTGQMPTSPVDGALVAGGVLTQAEQVRQNLLSCLRPFGATLDDALMVRVYLTEFDRDFAAFNEVYRTWFTAALPSRTCVGTNGLAAGADIEIDLVVGVPTS
ncbi:MAG: RidA family protein [Rhodoferax sp.]|nr:RidA family protein [Actinomycetota bacterium]